MTRYVVEVPEIWLQRVEIEADSEEEAEAKVRAGEGNYLDNALEYSSTLDDGWKVWGE